jgi:hypothetical protein
MIDRAPEVYEKYAAHMKEHAPNEPVLSLEEYVKGPYKDHIDRFTDMYKKEYGDNIVEYATANEKLPAAVAKLNEGTGAGAGPAGGNNEHAGSSQFLEQIVEHYRKMPEFVREDLLEGLLVGGGIALPIALMPNQDTSESAAVLLGGIGAATLGGAASRRIGAAIGRRVHPEALEKGSFGHNLGRIMGREDVIDSLDDMLGKTPVPVITGQEYGRAIGRAVGDEVFGIAGTLGGMALAQSMDSTPDAVPQPTVGQAAWGTIPGAALGLAASGLTGGFMDMVGVHRDIESGVLHEGNIGAEIGDYTMLRGEKFAGLRDRLLGRNRPASA